MAWIPFFEKFSFLISRGVISWFSIFSKCTFCTGHTKSWSDIHNWNVEWERTFWFIKSDRNFQRKHWAADDVPLHVLVKPLSPLPPGQLYGLEKFWAFLKYSKMKNQPIDPKLQEHLSQFKNLEDFRVVVSENQFIREAFGFNCKLLPLAWSIQLKEKSVNNG